MNGSNYIIGERLKDVFPHHGSFKALWETKWKFPCSKGLYPFQYAKLEDFEPIVTEIVRKDMRRPYDWDAYAQEFIPQAETLVKKAEQAEAAGDKTAAADLYLRASAVYRIARFPVVRSKIQQKAWTDGKDAFVRGQNLLPCGVKSLQIPHTHRLPDEGPEIPVYWHVPDSADASHPVPLLIVLCGLDGYRTDNSGHAKAMDQVNVGTIVLDLPGVGDSPASPSDPTSNDRQLNSVLDWVAKEPRIDEKRVCLWGLSTGGYSALRAAHVQHDRLRAAINHGGGSHHMFDRKWLDEVDHLEYPFDLAGSLAHKFGYDDVEKFKAEASDRYSLLKDGTLDTPCTETLLINGMDDSIFPIDDMFLALQHGPNPKKARFFIARQHMGFPDCLPVVVDFILKTLECPRHENDVQECLASMR